MQRLDKQQPNDYYKIMSGTGDSYCLPPEYFTGFANKLFVISTADLKTTINPFLSELAKANWLLKHPEGGDNLASFAGDLKRLVRIRIENAESGIIETVYDPADFFKHRDDIRHDLDGEGYIDYVYKAAALSLFSDSHELTTERFKQIGHAYYQKIIYFINEVIQNALADKHFLIMDANVVSDLVFHRDGSVSLDLYQASCAVACPAILYNDELLKAPCPAQIMVRIPFLQEKNLFGNPVIFCNEHTLPFLFSDKSMLLEKSPSHLGNEQKEALQQAIEEELDNKSENASIVKRQPTKGKHAKTIILGVAGLVTVVALTTMLAVPGGVAFVLGSLGILAAESAIPAGATAATVIAVAGIAGVTSAGATSTVYFTARAVIPRKLKFVMLDCCRFSDEDFKLIEANALAEAARLSLPPSPVSSPRLFAKGKEECSDHETLIPAEDKNRLT